METFFAHQDDVAGTHPTAQSDPICTFFTPSCKRVKTPRKAKNGPFCTFASHTCRMDQNGAGSPLTSSGRAEESAPIHFSTKRRVCSNGLLGYPTSRPVPLDRKQVQASQNRSATRTYLPACATFLSLSRFAAGRQYISAPAISTAVSPRLTG